MPKHFVHPLIDLDRLARWMDGQGLEEGPLVEPRLLSGGNQNVLLSFRRGNRQFILRRPPESPRRSGSETMRREARVLSAIGQSDVPHAALIAACPEEDVIGAAFYLMEPVDGFNAVAGLPHLHSANAGIRHEMGLALVDGLLALGRFDPAHPQLLGLGNPDAFLDRQVGRWQAQLAAYSDYQGWPGRGALGNLRAIEDWLKAHQPSEFVPGVMHGDYHVGNVMYRYDSPALAAIIDWELTTIGDPLLDLGGLLATWPADDGSRTVSITVQPWAGFPTMTELIARYRRHTHRDASHLRWYGVLACYKLGIVLEGTFARACGGKAALETGMRFHESAIRLLARSKAWVDSWELG